MTLLTDHPETIGRSRPSIARIGGVCGLGFAAAQLLAGLLAGTPPALDQSGAAMAEYFADHRTGILAAGVVNAIGALLVIAFLTALVERGGHGERRALVFGAGFAAVAVSFSATAIGTGAAAASQGGSVIGDSVASLALHAQTIGFLLIGIPAAVLVGAGSIGLGRRVQLLGAVTVAVMVGSQVAIAQPALGAIVLSRDLLFAAWLVGVAVTLLADDRRRTQSPV